MNTKEYLYNKCLEFVNNRLLTIQNTISEIQESLLSETKSSAGDKHETGRAMLQLEREKAGYQLSEAKKLQETLYKIDSANVTNRVVLGSVVTTSQFNYFIAISAGELKADDGTYFAISASTPIAQLLLSKQKGDAVSFRNQEFVIIDVA